MQVKHFFSVLFCFISLNVISQFKFEKEYRIKQSEVPHTATSFVRKIKPTGKIKWYVEESQQGKTFEAKFTYLSKKFSVEFFKDGKLADIEVKTLFPKIPKETQSTIKEELYKEFKKFKIRKTQIQYKGSEEELINYFQEHKTEKNLTINYEIVLDGKSQKGYQRYEFLFNTNGNKVSKLKFIPTNFDNLEF
ncbi:hypothetical protein [Tenacibaculum amylolyticum]|uniref:hypothetical protein n=1 Tax=Tenacibaculum amylolyticum TaxID=104269 RepID=UPI0038933842